MTDELQNNSAEIERLRAENLELRASARANSGFRKFWVGLLIVIASLAAVGGVLGVWLRVVALNTDNYVETVAPLPQNEVVAEALSELVVDEIYENLDTDGLAEALPAPLQRLAQPLEGVIRDFSVDVARKIITSDAFQAIWEGLNRFAHNRAVSVLTGRGSDILVTAQGVVTLDLSDAQAEVRAALEDAGLSDYLPAPGDAQVVLFTDRQFSELQTTVDLLDLAGWVLPVVSLLAFVGAIGLSRSRRRTIVWAGTVLAFAMAASLIYVDVLRNRVLGGITNETFAAAAADVWDTLFGALIAAHVGLLILGGLGAVIAAAAGPSRWASALRSSVRNRFDAWSGSGPTGEVSPGGLGTFVADHLAWLRAIGVAAALLVLVVWTHPTLLVAITTAIVLVVYLLALELVRAPGAAGASTQSRKDPSEE